MRARFARWAIPLGTASLLAATYAAWDAAEARWLRQAVEDVGASGAPTSLLQLEWPQTIEPASEDAAPYYLAASTLAASHVSAGQATLTNLRVVRARSAGRLGTHWFVTGEILHEELEQTRERLAAHADALRLLDKATALRFGGFAHNSRSRYGDYYLEMLADLASLRTACLAAERDGDGAVRSLVAELRLFGRHDSPLSFASLHSRLTVTLMGLGMLVNRVPLTEPQLAALSSELDAADVDDRMTRDIDLRRAAAISAFHTGDEFQRYYFSVPLHFPGSLPAFLNRVRPLAARHLRHRLARFEKLAEASRRPWPQRLDDMSSVARALNWQEDGGWLIAGTLLPPSDRGPTRSARGGFALGATPTETASTRIARIVVAIERHRIANGGALPDDLKALVPTYLPSIPIDPYSGGSLRYQRNGSQYKVYSVSINRRDDQGDLRLDQHEWFLDFGLSVSRSRSRGREP